MLSVAEPTPQLQLPTAIRALRVASFPVIHPGWSAALHDVVSGVQMRGIVLLTGQAGVGKTSLLQSVADTLLELGRLAVIVRPGDPLPSRQAVALIDDAHLLSPAELEGVLRRPGACVLTFPEGARALTMRHSRHITIVSLRPVAAAETSAFVNSWLSQSGNPPGLLSPSAAAALARHAGGLPGQIQAIARLAVFLARLEAADAVQIYHLAQAAETLECVGTDKSGPDDAEPPEGMTPPDDAPSRQPRYWRLVAPIFCGIVAVLASISPAWAPAVGSNRVVAMAADMPPASVPEPILAPDPASRLVPPPLRVTLLVAAGDRAALGRGTTLAGMLRDHGYTVDDPQPMALHLPTSELHYFGPPDAPSVAALSALLGSAIPITRRADVVPATAAQTGMVEILIPSDPRAGLQNRGNSLRCNPNHSIPEACTIDATFACAAACQLFRWGSHR